MLEIRITAPELAEAVNNLAGALSGKSDSKMEIAATTAQRFLVPSEIPKYIAYLKENFGFSDADIQTVCGDYARANLIEQPTPNPTTPATAPQTATVAPNTPPVNYPIDVNQSVAQPAQVVTTPPAQQPTTPAVPTSAPQYTLEMISVAGTALFDAGKGKELTGLLAKYGVDALTSLDPAYYGAFATELRAMGASI